MLTRAQFLVLIICTTLQTVMMQQDIVRIGCYKEGEPYEMQEYLEAKNMNTVHFCLKYCKSKGYNYTAVQNGKWCSCGDSYGKYGQVGDSKCVVPCEGNKLTTCGGSWTNEIYKTYFDEPKRLGCYRDNAEKRDLSDKKIINNEMTVAYCLAYCRSFDFPYTAVRSGNVCSCGITFGLYGNASDIECNYNCRGDSSTTCGGLYTNEIYATGQYPIGRLGCYKEAEVKAQNELTNYHVHYAGSKASVSFCQNYCTTYGYNYTNVKGVTCGCRFSYDGYEKVSDMECTLPCEGNKLTTCGEYKRTEIYKNMDKSFRIGCYKDAEPYEMHWYLEAKSIATVPFCVNYCKSKGYIYTAVQNGKWCSCGNFYGKYGKATESECKVPCEGNRLTTCGGKLRNEIYKNVYFG